MIARLVPLAALLVLAVPAHADERRFMLTSFDSVRVEGPFEVAVTTGGTTGAVATADMRALDSIEVAVESRVLVIRPGQQSWGGYPGTRGSAPRLRVTVPSLRAATVQGGGKLSVDRMAGQRIDLRLTGAGAIDVADAQADQIEGLVVGTGAVRVGGGRAQRARFLANGAGSIAAEGLALGSLWLDWQSVGDAKFAVRYTAEIYAQGQGPVVVTGAPACKVFGTGPVSCGNVVERRP